MLLSLSLSLSLFLSHSLSLTFSLFFSVPYCERQVKAAREPKKEKEINCSRANVYQCVK